MLSFINLMSREKQGRTRNGTLGKTNMSGPVAPDLHLHLTLPYLHPFRLTSLLPLLFPGEAVPLKRQRLTCGQPRLTAVALQSPRSPDMLGGTDSVVGGGLG